MSGQGLSEAEARQRLLAEGPNALPGRGRRSLLALAADVLEEPMLLLLLAAGAIYMVLGDMHEALVLLAFAGLSILIELVQQGRTDRAIAALGQLGAPRALVIREGERRHVASSEVVRGDLLVLDEGARILADGWVIEARDLSIDEAALTGESVPVRKRALASDEAGDEAPLPGGDGLPYAYSGTLAVRGSGLLRVSATGPRSRIGLIGQSLAAIVDDQPRLAAQTRRLVRLFALFGMGVSVLAGLLYGLTRGGWLDALLAGIALAMSMLPEELPVVLALFLTMGALRLSRVRVLARRGSAIETLGAATVLCTDKTGTLTQNRMAIAELRLPDGRSFCPGETALAPIPQPFVELAGLGILACLEQPFDPMEVAFHELGERHAGQGLLWRQDEGWRVHRQYALSSGLLAMSNVWGGDGDEHVIAAKGAPEAIARLCDMNEAARTEMEAAAKAMAGNGLRVLGIAEAGWTGEAFPEEQHHFPFVWRGLVGLADPIRETVPEAMRSLRRAGIRVVMITGDYPETARAVAARAGIGEGVVMTGEELRGLDPAALAARIGAVAVFARVMPEDKLRIVEALKAAGEVVAMTGDGVNDAPSLKAAHIGIAMGRRGTDVARESAAIVLLDDDFGAIPAALGLGRRIYDNLRKAMAFIFAVHLPIGGLALAPLLTGWPIILGPMHIALLEMVIDPVCALAFEAEPEEPDVLRRPPRPPQSALFPRALLGWSVLQGLLVLAVLLVLATWAQAQPADVARATIFAGLVGSVLVLVAINRNFAASGGVRGMRRNRALLAIMGVVAAFFALLFGVPAFAGLFRLVSPGVEGLAAAALAGMMALAVLGLAKRRFRKVLTG